ncbi:MAG: polyprenyl synthetase family protein [Chloroflexi bacterium]|nr:polyprenyl synthetase family protein [Chloroflexota bacterium]
MVDRQKEALLKARKYLDAYKRRTNHFLEKYLNDRIQILVKAETNLGRELGETVRDSILSPGKRMRAAFVHCGYRAVGGTNEKKINFASASIEILQSFFLIHDDIIDKSNLRRGEPTVHLKYRQIYESKGLLNDLNSNDREHFASSAAIMAGDVCCALAYEALFESGFEDKNTIEALKMMQKTVLLTGVGEMIDVITPLYKMATEEDVLRIHYLKTALYTVEAPLLLGAILHGTSSETLGSLSRYGHPVGIAFQIQDDILGMFGTEKELGKPIGSDIREGKRTLLTVKAFENASASQKKKMEAILGNPAVSELEIQEFKDIIESTGSLEYSRHRAAALINEGKEALVGVPIQEDVKERLFGIADYIIERRD